ncbi:MAG TPA: hypothetical protein VHE55_16680 [Fimbriimonadaceae bacterium]|nr:hypothetical protein [Fimbriimonadaceae bacterium]
MIFQIAREGNEWTANVFLDNWGKELAPRFRTVMFHELSEVKSLPVGTYLFGDLEIATQGQRRLLAQLWNALEQDGRSHLFNHPVEAMGRYDLLKTLAREGINDFRAFRIDELPRDLRFPVFLRIESDHWGSRTPLLETWRELDRWLIKAALGDGDAGRLLVTEFCDTSDRKGLYRKFSAFCIGGDIVPRHVHFSRNWMLKMADLATPETLEEERRYMDDVPFKEEIRAIFRLAHIDYGRIDYSFQDGRIQVWEINTNPTLTIPEADYPPAVVPTQKRFAASMVEALKRIDSTTETGQIPFRMTGTSLPCS